LSIGATDLACDPASARWAASRSSSSTVATMTALPGASLSGGVREERAWWITFGDDRPDRGDRGRGSPVTSLNVLAVLLGIWFIVMGIFEIIGGFMLKHDLCTVEPAHA
jgi:Short repeat of unknown function (DUF308)